MGQIAVDVTLANNHDVQMAAAGVLAPEQIRRAQLLGLVGSSSMKLILPAGIVSQLGLKFAGEAMATYADQRTATRQVVEEVRVELLGRHGTFSAIVEPDRTTALVGAIVLEDLDFVVDCARQQLQPRDPNRIVSEIE
jgi:hypothetical protein